MIDEVDWMRGTNRDDQLEHSFIKSKNGRMGRTSWSADQVYWIIVKSTGKGLTLSV